MQKENTEATLPSDIAVALEKIVRGESELLPVWEAIDERFDLIESRLDAVERLVNRK